MIYFLQEFREPYTYRTRIRISRQLIDATASGAARHEEQLPAGK